MKAFEIANAQDQGSREEQQDAAGIRELDYSFAGYSGVIGVLCDGMGGMKLGSAAARLAVATFLDAFTAASNPRATPEQLRRALEAANQAVLSLARRNKSERQVACTLVAAWLFNDWLHWISVGDSRAYLIRNGELYRLTVDHTYAEDRRLPAGEPSESPSGQLIDPEAVSSFIGYPGKPRVDASVRPLGLVAGDCVLLGSDGLYKALPQSEISACLDSDLLSGCQALVDRVLAAGFPDQDNVTVLAIRFNG